MKNIAKYAFFAGISYAAYVYLRENVSVSIEVNKPTDDPYPERHYHIEDGIDGLLSMASSAASVLGNVVSSAKDSVKSFLS